MIENRFFYLENLGCAKNQVDAEVIISLLKEHAWEPVTKPEEASVIIINTCGFISEAKEESIETGLSFKETYPGKKVIMAGCLSERYGDILKKQLTEIDGFVGNKDLSGVVELMPGTKRKKLISGERKHLLSLPGSTYVKISEGCDHRCTYCSIPIIRGGLKSRGITEILEEIKMLQDLEVVEFNLIAQDLSSFGRDRNEESPGDIVRLFEAIARLPGRFWVRPLYIHPDHFPYGLLDIIKSDNRFLPYFDLPFQHAAAAVLKKMGRRGDAPTYLKLIKHIRREIPGAVLRSTFMVGFPGETEKYFEELLSFQAEAELDWLGMFTYSREEDTPAYKLPGRVGKKEAARRKGLLEEAQVPITERRLSRLTGRKLDILVEEPVKNETLFIGRTYAQAPEVDGLVVIHGINLEPGKLVQGEIIKQNGFDLEADVLP